MDRAHPRHGGGGVTREEAKAILAKCEEAERLDKARRDAGGNWLGESDEAVERALTLNTEVALFVMQHAKELLTIAAREP